LLPLDKRNETSVEGESNFFLFSSVFRLLCDDLGISFNGRRVLEVELTGLTQCARCDSINSVPSLPLSLYHYTSAVVICVNICLRTVYVRTRTYDCVYKEWLDAFPGVRDYVNMRGQVWNKMFLCPEPNGRLRARELLSFIWSIEDSNFLFST